MLRRLTPLLLLLAVAGFVALPSPQLRIGADAGLRWDTSGIPADDGPDGTSGDQVPAVPEAADAASVVVAGRDDRPEPLTTSLLGLLTAAILLGTERLGRRGRRRPRAPTAVPDTGRRWSVRAVPRRGPPALA